MKGQPEVLRTNFEDFGHFGSFLTFLTDDLSLFDQILAIFGQFWTILGRSEVREGAGRWRIGPAKGSSEPGRGLGGVRDQGREGSEVDFGHFWPSGVKI